MESTISKSTFYADERPVVVDIRFSLDPYDWYELKATDAWQEVERLISDFGSRDNLIRRLEALNLKEKATIEQVLPALPPPHQATSCKSQQTDIASMELPRHPVLQKLKKLISREKTCW